MTLNLDDDLPIN